MFQDDKIKIDIKLEAQQRYCTNKANTAIANMKALTDSIPTPRSWHSPSSTGSAPGPGGMVSPAASGMPVAPPTMGHMQPPPPTVAGAPQTSVVGGPPVMTGGVDSANGPAGSGISNVNLPSGNIKQVGIVNEGKIRIYYRAETKSFLIDLNWLAILFHYWDFLWLRFGKNE